MKKLLALLFALMFLLMPVVVTAVTSEQEEEIQRRADEILKEENYKIAKEAETWCYTIAGGRPYNELSEDEKASWNNALQWEKDEKARVAELVDYAKNEVINDLRNNSNAGRPAPQAGAPNTAPASIPTQATAPAPERTPIPASSTDAMSQVPENIYAQLGTLVNYADGRAFLEQRIDSNRALLEYKPEVQRGKKARFTFGVFLTDGTRVNGKAGKLIAYADEIDKELKVKIDKKGRVYFTVPKKYPIGGKIIITYKPEISTDATVSYTITVTK